MADKGSEYLSYNGCIPAEFAEKLDTLERKPIRWSMGISLLNAYIRGELKLALRTDRLEILHLSACSKRLCSSDTRVKLLALHIVEDWPRKVHSYRRIGNGPPFFDWDKVPSTDPTRQELKQAVVLSVLRRGPDGRQHFKPDVVIARRLRSGLLEVRVLDACAGSPYKLCWESDLRHELSKVNLISTDLFSFEGAILPLGHKMLMPESRLKAVRITEFKTIRYQYMQIQRMDENPPFSRPNFDCRDPRSSTGCHGVCPADDDSITVGSI